MCVKSMVGGKIVNSFYFLLYLYLATLEIATFIIFTPIHSFEIW